MSVDRRSSEVKIKGKINGIWIQKSNWNLFNKPMSALTAENGTGSAVSVGIAIETRRTKLDARRRPMALRDVVDDSTGVAVDLAYSVDSNCRL